MGSGRCVLAVKARSVAITLGLSSSAIITLTSRTILYGIVQTLTGVKIPNRERVLVIRTHNVAITVRGVPSVGECMTRRALYYSIGFKLHPVLLLLTWYLSTAICCCGGWPGSSSVRNHKRTLGN
jgi:hypothetical protein